jgi:hypothetical protein
LNRKLIDAPFALFMQDKETDKELKGEKVSATSTVADKKESAAKKGLGAKKKGNNKGETDAKTDKKKKKKKVAPDEEVGSAENTREDLARADGTAEWDVRVAGGKKVAMEDEQKPPSRPRKPEFASNPDIYKYVRFAVCGNDDVHLYDENLITVRSFRTGEAVPS